MLSKLVFLLLLSVDVLSLKVKLDMNIRCEYPSRKEFGGDLVIWERDTYSFLDDRVSDNLRFYGNMGETKSYTFFSWEVKDDDWPFDYDLEPAIEFEHDCSFKGNTFKNAIDLPYCKGIYDRDVCHYYVNVTLGPVWKQHIVYMENEVKMS